jgi:hypothetical protein
MLRTRLYRLVQIENLGSEGDGAFTDAKEGIDRGDEILVICVTDTLNLRLFVTCKA